MTNQIQLEKIEPYEDNALANMPVKLRFHAETADGFGEDAVITVFVPKAPDRPLSAVRAEALDRARLLLAAALAACGGA